MNKIKFFSKKIFVLNFILQPLFQSAQHFYEKKEESGSGSVIGIVTNRSGYGSETPKNI